MRAQGLCPGQGCPAGPWGSTAPAPHPPWPLCKVPAASRGAGALSVGQGVPWTLLPPSGFVVCSAKREVSLGVRGELPRARPVPAPKSCARGCRWPVLPPSLPLSIRPSVRPSVLPPRCRTLAPPPPSQLLKAIVSIACSSLLRSRCLRACSSFSNAAKIWGERGGETVRKCPPTQSGSLWPAGSLMASGHGDAAPWELFLCPSRAKGSAR